MKNKILYIYFALFFILSTGCKKTDPSPVTSQKVSLLVKTWKISKVTDIGQGKVIYQNPLPSGQTITEDYSRYRIAFTTDAYTIIDKGGATGSGLWELASNETKLILDKGVQGKETIMMIIEVSSASLKVNYTENSNKTGNRELLIEMINQ